MLNDDVVYIPHNTNLGDHITSYCLMASLGLRHGKRYKLSTQSQWGQDFSHRLREIESVYCLDLTHWPSPILVDEPGTEKVDPWMNWIFPAVPMGMYKWTPSTAVGAGNERIKRQDVNEFYCYQFDGISSSSANPDPLLQQYIHTHMEMMGYEGIRLGKELSLSEICELLTGCSFFVGSDSGMSHLAHSVGCPVFLYEGAPPVHITHKNKAYGVFRDFQEFRDRTDHWLWFLSL